MGKVTWKIPARYMTGQPLFYTSNTKHKKVTLVLSFWERTLLKSGSFLRLQSNIRYKCWSSSNPCSFPIPYHTWDKLFPDTCSFYV